MIDSFDQKLKWAIDLCEGKYVDRNFVRIYPFTTENISGYINNFDLKNKSLLTLGSSGDQVLNSAMFKCKDISVLDICPFTKFYFYLKKAAILTLTYDEFLSFFCYINFPKTFENNKDVFKKEVFLKLKQTLRLLDYKSFLFWDDLFYCYNPITIRTSLFERDEDKHFILKATNLYLSSDLSFNSCKMNIKNINPEFIIGNVENVKLYRNYDNIWLSNLGQYLEIEKLKIIVDNLFCNLNNEGKILLCYLYQTTKTTKYRKEWAKIYNLSKVYKVFNNYLLELDSFLGVHGILWNCNNIKDSILVYKK